MDKVLGTCNDRNDRVWEMKRLCHVSDSSSLATSALSWMSDTADLSLVSDTFCVEELGDQFLCTLQPHTCVCGYVCERLWESRRAFVVLPLGSNGSRVGLLRFSGRCVTLRPPVLCNASGGNVATPVLKCCNACVEMLQCLWKNVAMHVEKCFNAPPGHPPGPMWAYCKRQRNQCDACVKILCCLRSEVAETGGKSRGKGWWRLSLSG